MPVDTGAYNESNEDYAGFLRVSDGDVIVRLMFPRDTSKPPEVFVSDTAIRMLPLDVQAARYPADEPKPEPETDAPEE